LKYFFASSHLKLPLFKVLVAISALVVQIRVKIYTSKSLLTSLALCRLSILNMFPLLASQQVVCMQHPDAWLRNHCPCSNFGSFLKALVMIGADKSLARRPANRGLGKKVRLLL
jgi:hypothetical protein